MAKKRAVVAPSATRSSWDVARVGERVLSASLSLGYVAIGATVMLGRAIGEAMPDSSGWLPRRNGRALVSKLVP